MAAQKHSNPLENGRGRYDASPRYVCIVNKNSFGFGLAGHSGILLQSSEGTLSLYSFHPFKSPDAIGSVAQLTDAHNTWDDFVNACRHDGPCICNGYHHWQEPFNRYIKMDISLSAWEAIKEWCENRVPSPPRYLFLSYNCQDFVDEALAAGGITLRNSGSTIAKTPKIPNVYFDDADSTTTEINSFDKAWF